MGMTKRLAEAYLKYLKIHSKTDFKATRFGNIFGSNGSVLPVFLRQITTGKPLTLTTCDTSRYFISKTKAGQLILKTATLSKSDGYLFTFNMGKPIKILDLAKALTKRITGNDKYPIEFIGLRAGEKVHEDLLSKTEDLEFTMHDDILKIKSLQGYSGEKISFNLLSSVKSNISNSEIKHILEDCIITLQSSPALLFAI
jgi:FlaA1/EpsC-like NDP-sugar epimerase